jgi:ADP-ribosyl-[dinitrogen reductase] hydrolase
MKNFNDQVMGSLFGLVVGDALGASVEFKKRGSYPRIEFYQGGGEFNLLPGQWTDDTSLALCLIESFNTKKKCDFKNQMDLFVRWWKEGYLSSTGFCFDIGNTTKASLSRYLDSGNPLAGLLTDPATNGALMRLAPIPLFFHQSLSDSIKYSGLQSQTTHAPVECVEAAMLLSYVMYFFLQGKSLEETLLFRHFEPRLKTRIKNLKEGLYKTKNEIEIHGTGDAYSTLEAALFALFHFKNFEEGLYFVVNLGDDTDTVGAVYGQLAGAFYGMSQIPKKLIDNIFDKEKCEIMFYEFLRVINEKN